MRLRLCVWSHLHYENLDALRIRVNAKIREINEAQTDAIERV